jgi:hypothetical protein
MGDAEIDAWLFAIDRFSIARPSTSVGAAGMLMATSKSAEKPFRKRTSGEVHAATARRMCCVRKVKPTWYAAAQTFQY